MAAITNAARFKLFPHSKMIQAAPSITCLRSKRRSDTITHHFRLLEDNNRSENCEKDLQIVRKAY